MIKSMTLAAGMFVASCTQIATCLNDHGHHPHNHHPVCEAPTHPNDDNGPPAPPPAPPIEPPPPPRELVEGHKNNGFGNGNQDAPGKSEFHNNAENAGGNN